MNDEGASPGPGSDGTGRPRTRAQVQSDLAGDRKRMHDERRRRPRRWPIPLIGLAAVAAAVFVVTGSGRSGHSQQVASAPVSPKITTNTNTNTNTTATTTTTTTTTAPPYVPPQVTPTVTPPQAGEGTWTATDTWDPGPPSLMTTTFRPDRANPSTVAYAVWMRSSSTQLALYPGYKGPGTIPAGMDRGPQMIPTSGRPSLLAAFNSGFYTADSAAGFYAHGNLYDPMINGLATVVSRTDGTVDIAGWTGGPTPDASVVTARQNLPLLVDAGAPTVAAQTPSTWGLTLHGVPQVWRTGLGIDGHGNLIYVAAPFQTAASLAQLLVQLGSVRGMQLDINPEWPVYITYGGPGAASPMLFVPNPNQIASRFLYSSTKDFFAIYQKPTEVTVQPW